MKVYVHGTGRAGREAWPLQPDHDAVFLDLTTAATMDDRAAMVAAATRQDGAAIVAHSAGAIPALLAVRSGAARSQLLVLLEPALYDVARGVGPIEEHIAAMTEARAHADAGDLLGYWSIVRPMMFGGPVDVDRWPEERPTAERLAAVEVPWGYGLDGSDIEGITTVVITGAWNAEYEAIAEVLARHGARHAQLPGHGHRPQDHRDFGTLLDRWMA